MSNKQQYSGALDSLNDYVNKRQGLIGGVVTEFRFNSGFAIQPEVLYARRGSQFKVGSDDFYIQQRTQINYVEIPILLKAGFAAGPVRLDVLAGPSWSYALDGEVTTKTQIPFLGTSESVDEIDFDSNSDIKRTEWSAQAGVSLSAGIGNSRFFIDGRYLYGITNTSESDEANNQYEAKNRGTALTAGLLFGF